jgi:hypothetical protein
MVGLLASIQVSIAQLQKLSPHERDIAAILSQSSNELQIQVFFLMHEMYRINTWDRPSMEYYINQSTVLDSQCKDILGFTSKN